MDICPYWFMVAYHAFLLIAVFTTSEWITANPKAENLLESQR